MLYMLNFHGILVQPICLETSWVTETNVQLEGEIRVKVNK